MGWVGHNINRINFLPLHKLGLIGLEIPPLLPPMAGFGRDDNVILGLSTSRILHPPRFDFFVISGH